MRSYSCSQHYVTLSSGEAELVALVRASTEAIGLAQLGACWGLDLGVEIFVDSSAALAVTSRKGYGRLRHVRVGQLWVQEAAEREMVRYSKVGGSRNPADLLTKYLAAPRALELTKLLSQAAIAGQAKLKLGLHSCRGPCSGKAATANAVTSGSDCQVVRPGSRGEVCKCTCPDTPSAPVPWRCNLLCA